MYEIPKPERTNFNDVGSFHEKFGLDNTTFHPPGPRELTSDVIDFRIRFMREELDEFCEAWEDGAEEGMFDALLDLVYVAMGTAHFLGYPWQEGWDRIQRANMQKIRAQADASDSKRGHALDVVKPDGWEPPDHRKLLESYGW